jgi:hypothetical protein
MHNFLAKKTVLSFGLAGLFIACCNLAQADGLSDLKASLNNLPGTAQLKAFIDVKTTKRGEGKGQEESSGQANLSIESNARGMHVIYSKDMLTLLENEERAKEKDSKKKTPTLNTMNSVSTTALRQIASSSSQLSRTIENATFKGEKVDTFNGKPARVLNFEMSIDNLFPKESEVVKKFESTLVVWIAADGTPLASKSHQFRSIRFMMVISVDITEDVDLTYGIVGDRLVTLKKESKSSGSGMGGKGDDKTTMTLQIQP